MARRSALLACLAVALALAACGGGDGGDAMTAPRGSTAAVPITGEMSPAQLARCSPVAVLASAACVLAGAASAAPAAASADSTAPSAAAPADSAAPSPAPPDDAAAPPSTGAGARRATTLLKLRWAPPRLTRPLVVRLSATNRAPRLDPRRDYLVRLPRRALGVPGGIVISGGRNVVLIGGEIAMPRQPDAEPQLRRALFLKDQTGTIHVEGVRISGDVSDAIDLQQPYGATVQLQNISVAGAHARDRVHFTDTHPDLIQSWAGPRRLRIDGFSGTTDYQGFFLDSTEQADASAATRELDLRRVDLHGTRTAGYLFWLGRRCAQPTACTAIARPRVTLSQVFAAPNPTKPAADQVLWQDPAPWLPAAQAQARSVVPRSSVWAGVALGRPPGGGFVPAARVGTRYRAPGYAGRRGSPP